MFSEYGKPHVIVTDNGRQFISTLFEVFLRKNGVRHLKPPPPWHTASNGVIERTVQTFKRLLSKFQVGDIHARLARILFAMRTTPSSRNGLTPAEVLGRPFRTHLTQLHPGYDQLICPSQRAVALHPGEGVWVLKHTLNAAIWIPGVISKSAGARTYEIKLADGKTMVNVSADHVRRRFVADHNEADEASRNEPPRLQTPRPIQVPGPLTPSTTVRTASSTPRFTSTSPNSTESIPQELETVILPQTNTQVHTSLISNETVSVQRRYEASDETTQEGHPKRQDVNIENSTPGPISESNDDIIADTPAETTSPGTGSKRTARLDPNLEEVPAPTPSTSLSSGTSAEAPPRPPVPPRAVNPENSVPEPSQHAGSGEPSPNHSGGPELSRESPKTPPSACPQEADSCVGASSEFFGFPEDLGFAFEPAPMQKKKKKKKKNAPPPPPRGARARPPPPPLFFFFF